MFRVSAYDPEDSGRLLDRPTRIYTWREALDFLRACGDDDAYAELDVLRGGQWWTLATLSGFRVDRQDRLLCPRPPLPVVNWMEGEG